MGLDDPGLDLRKNRSLLSKETAANGSGSLGSDAFTERDHAAHSNRPNAVPSRRRIHPRSGLAKHACHQPAQALRKLAGVQGNDPRTAGYLSEGFGATVDN